MSPKGWSIFISFTKDTRDCADVSSVLVASELKDAQTGISGRCFSTSDLNPDPIRLVNEVCIAGFICLSLARALALIDVV